MKYLKRFEAWGFDPLPITSLDVVTDYILCNSCNALYKIYKPKSNKCKYCTSSDINNISEEEYYSEMQNRLDSDEFKDALIDREKDRNTFVNLYDVDNEMN